MSPCRLCVRRDVGDVVGPVGERVVPRVAAGIRVFDRHPSRLCPSCRREASVASPEASLVRGEEETRLERELATDAAILVEGLPTMRGLVRTLWEASEQHESIFDDICAGAAAQQKGKKHHQKASSTCALM